MAQHDLEAFRKAVEDRICRFCVDADDKGLCQRPHTDPCPLVTHLDPLVQAILAVGGSDDISDYVRALRAQVCSTCRQDDAGACTMRQLAECALDSYLIPVIEVVEDVAGVKKG